MNLDEIAEFYISRGYKDHKLRQVLEKDKEYQKLIKARKNKLQTETKITNTERKKYVLSVERDFEILKKCKSLEKLKLSNEDKVTVRLIMTQLEADWRKLLINKLNVLLRKYRAI